MAVNSIRGLRIQDNLDCLVKYGPARWNRIERTVRRAARNFS